MAKAEDGKPIKDEDRPNGQLAATSTSLRRRTTPRRSWSSWLSSNVLRLGLWYSIFTVLFLCPSDPKSLDATHSVVCKPYLNAKHFIDPFVGPYYDTYASPYVERAKPYVDTANTRIIKPATVLAIDNYNKYAAPQVSKARDYTSAEWEKWGLPRLQMAQEAVQQVYDDNLAPHVQMAQEAATPYYENVRENALNVREKHIIPAIAYSQPHVSKAFVSTQKFWIEKAQPFIQYAYSNTVIFVDGTVWPFLKKLYADNIRPQLVMIGERIAKYQEGRKLQSAMDDIDVSTTLTSTSEVSESATSTTANPTSTSVESSSTATSSETQKPRVATDETISEDLIKWQKKFALAADKGTEDLKERIEDITAGFVKSDLSDGRSLATTLEKTVEVQLATIKAKIKGVAATLAEDGDENALSAAEADIVQSFRDAGSQIKDRARQVRSWSDTFKTNLKQRTELATDTTLHVLDDIRDLGLQEIGMRWAWMEGVTYKHWQKYHDLKKKFADWRSEVRQVALSNPVIADANEQADKVLEESMAVTEAAAKELVRLKDVAKWKVASRDASDDFDSRAIPVVAAAASAASSVAGDIKQAIMGKSQGTVESIVSAASQQLEEVGKSASSVVAGTTGTAESLVSGASLSASILSESASSLVLGSTGTIESLASEASSSAASALSGASSGASAALSDASSSASSALSEASSGVVGTSTGTVESVASSLSDAASSQYSSATDSASSWVASVTTGPSEGVLSSASSIADSLSSSASSEIVSASASAKFQEAVEAAGDKVKEFTSSLKPE